MSTMMKTRSETDDEDARIQRQKKQTRRPVFEDRQRSEPFGHRRHSVPPLPLLVQTRKWWIGTFPNHFPQRNGKKGFLMINKTFMFYEVWYIYSGKTRREYITQLKLFKMAPFAITLSVSQQIHPRYILFNYKATEMLNSQHIKNAKFNVAQVILLDNM